ncbi:glycoside hydrolase family 32 protein [Dorea sp. D27]|uniref:glycoside hydrolase family 32 protein n=1 Tax=Dorea sp. D27 TaxID=658665 RepID=UPI0006737955|nr:glycoside hydrolase family 32 protein [Dorea sp. D27]KMZ54783.1 putative sucrose-6-phosphate hydrolase [Dorea sp. D27]
MLKDVLHLKAPGNWINDPNGFIYYKGQYHMFYQYFPYAPVWGTMHWGHATSSDLIHWEHHRTALFPTKDYDRNGIFSGSALELDGRLAVYYSAVRYLKTDKENIHTAVDEAFETSQAMIISDDGMQFDNWNEKRQIIPVVHDDETADSRHTRDPKVWEYNGIYYMALGSTYREEAGRILFYRSLNGLEWEYLNQYRSSNYGRIMECPDIFRVDGSYIFVGSAMYIMEDGFDYRHHAVCAPCRFRPDTCDLKLPDTYQYMDYGLDFYAPQSNVDTVGRRVVIGWMRMPEAAGDRGDGRGAWNGILSLPRVVKCGGGHVCFRVHPEVDQCFSHVVEDQGKLDFQQPFRLKASLMEGSRLNVGGYEIWIEDDCLRTDRSRVFPAGGRPRLVNCTPKLGGKYELDIFVEPNVIEIFVNNGQYVLSNVVYHMEPHIEGEVWELSMMRENKRLH